MTNALQWTVLGYGALGQLFGRALLKNGATVTYRSRQEPLINHFTRYPSDIVLAAVKAYDVAPFISEWQAWLNHKVSNKTPLLWLSFNGVLTNESELFSEFPVASLVTTHGAFIEDGELIHAGNGEIWCGALNHANSVQNEQHQQAITMLNNALPPAYFEANITQRRWLKLAINCLINPLTAAYNLRNGDLCETEYIAKQHLLAEEFALIANAHGHYFEVEQLVASAQSVCRTTAKNYSSMWQDKQRGRRTEIDYLNGFIASEGERLGIQTPTHHDLWQRLR